MKIATIGSRYRLLDCVTKLSTTVLRLSVTQLTVKQILDNEIISIIAGCLLDLFVVSCAFGSCHSNIVMLAVQRKKFKY